MSTKTFSPQYSRSSTGQKYSPLPKSAKIVIAGAGAFGGWAALCLREAGYEVTLVDPWGPGNSRSSSGGETRLIRSIYGDNELYTTMAARSFDLWHEYEAKLGRKVLFDLPTWWFCSEPDDALLDESVELLQKHKLPYRILNLDEVSNIHPHIHVEDLSHVLVEEVSGYLMAREATIAVANYFESIGGKFVDSAVSKVSSVEQGKVRCELSNGNSLKGDLFIAACGPWLPKVFPSLARYFDVSRQDVFYFGTPPDFGRDYPNWVDRSTGEFFYGLPQGSNRGFKVALDRRGEIFDPTTGSRIPDQSHVEECARFLALRFPRLENAPLIEHRVCQYCNTPDGNFIFDVHPDIENCWILGGGSGHGFKHGPALGEFVTQVLSGQSANEAMFEFKRFK